MSIFRPFRRAVLAIIVAGVPLSGGLIEPAQAQSSAMTCDQLWYARNAIYAREGYCFTTERGRAVFGAGCFPPFGRLTPGEQDQVHAFQFWEREKGCPQ